MRQRQVGFTPPKSLQKGTAGQVKSSPRKRAIRLAKLTGTNADSS